MKQVSKWQGIVLIFIILIGVFFVSRLYNILSLPIFTDEAIYLRWSQIAKNDASWRFISLTDGKQPMLIWFIMSAMRIVQDPLLAGRLVSVFAGLTSMIGLFFLGSVVFKNKWIGVFTSFFYVVFPMALVYDRMALYDSLVGTFTVWSLYLTVLLIRKVRLDVALILGMVIGGGILTKTSNFFSIYLLPFSLVLFDFAKKQQRQRFVKWIALALISIISAYAYYSILRLSPFFHIINEKNALFVYPLKEWLQHPWTFFIGNIIGQVDWLFTYLTLPILLLVFLSFFINKTYFKEKLFLLIWFILPLLALALFGKTLYPRFIFFMTLSLLPLSAFSIFIIYQKIKNKILFGFCLLLLVSVSIYSDYRILTNFSKSPIPYVDLNQYINDWPAGGGVSQAVDFFRSESEKGKIYVATQGTFGLLPYALEIYLVDNPNIVLKGFWPTDQQPPKEVMEAAQRMPTYFVFYQPCNLCRSTGEPPINWSLKLISSYEKPIGNSRFSIYQVNP